jgi:hypothetical protein
MVKRYHGSFPSFSYEFDSRYPLQHYPTVLALNTKRLAADYGILIACFGIGQLGKIRNVWEGFEVRPPDFHPDQI